MRGGQANEEDMFLVEDYSLRKCVLIKKMLPLGVLTLRVCVCACVRIIYLIRVFQK